MADFTEEILKREITNGEAMVEQLTGIKEALANSGSGGGNVTSGPLWVWIYEVTEKTENGLNLQTFGDTTTEPGTGGVANKKRRTDKTASEIRAAAGRGMIFAVYFEVEDEDVTHHSVALAKTYTVSTYEGLLMIELDKKFTLIENSETGYLEATIE